MVADEVMAGFGRTGRWFAVDHWDVMPDLMTMAKGLTQLVPAARRGGACATRIAEAFETKMFYGGLTYISHPVSLRRGARDDLACTRRTTSSATPRRLGPVMRGAPRAAGREAPARRGAPQPRACSGSSTSSAAATRGRR